MCTQGLSVIDLCTQGLSVIDSCTQGLYVINICRNHQRLLSLELCAQTCKHDTLTPLLAYVHVHVEACTYNEYARWTTVEGACNGWLQKMKRKFTR